MLEYQDIALPIITTVLGIAVLNSYRIGRNEGKLDMIIKILTNHMHMKKPKGFSKTMGRKSHRGS